MVAEGDYAMHAPSELTLTSTYHPGSQGVGLLRGHVAAALTHLAGSGPSAAKIHAARKELQRARATLRLMREAIAPNQYNDEDAQLRRAAQMLNDVRDAEVLLRAFARLRSSLKEARPHATLEPLHKLLREERRRATAANLQRQLPNARAVLMQAGRRTREWSVANDMDLLTRGMQRTYRKGRLCYRAACQSPSDDRLHAWRRQVKYCTYQLEALGSIGSAKAAKRLRSCMKLADLLGKDHDLAMLHERVAAADLDASSTLCCADAIKRQRARLQRKALKLGARLYRAKPRKFRPLRRRSSAANAYIYMYAGGTASASSSSR
ncbi:MAG TPA: CHAD domain-containing protein [Steroidobacteraceae bacterium]|nr:CHAD domain-containing protein [Steroidobacteraceae bacterium]